MSGAASYAPSQELLAVLAKVQARGAIGPGVLAGHVRHASAFVDAMGSAGIAAATVLDLGSGGGLPGLVIAERLPSLACVLLDGRTGRTRLLAEAVDLLGWGSRVRVVAERAESAAHRVEFRHRFDVVVARSFGAPAVTAECAAGFLRRGGILVVSEPPTGHAERWPRQGCAGLGLVLLDPPDLPWSFALLRATTACGPRYPRRVGIPAKRPLF